MSVTPPRADTDVLTVLVIGVLSPPEARSSWGRFEWRAMADAAGAAQSLDAAALPDALVLADAAGAALPLLAEPGCLAGVARRVPVVVVLRGADAADAAAAEALVALGVQDVLPADAGPDALARALRLAVARHRDGAAHRPDGATDVATGLPTQAQLLGHMTHLLALREREPAPMALIVLQVDGLDGAAIGRDSETTSLLRRKVAVRLRAALRASDVVASIGEDRLAVLLAWIDTPEAGPRVAAKLAARLGQPFRVGGQAHRVGVRAGLAAYPGHGREAGALLARARAQASSATTAGEHGLSQAGGPAPAANDD